MTGHGHCAGEMAEWFFSMPRLSGKVLRHEAMICKHSKHINVPPSLIRVNRLATL